MAQQERFLPSGYRREHTRNPEAERSCSLQRDMSGHGRGQMVLQENRQLMTQDCRQPVAARSYGSQENCQPLPHAQAVQTHHSSVQQSASPLQLRQGTGSSQRGNPVQRVQQQGMQASEPDSLDNGGTMKSAEVTGKLTAEYARMTGKIDNLQLCLNRSEETCREANTMKKRLQDDILQLQKSNEQLTQQLQTEIVLRDSSEAKTENVHSVCVMLAEHCERVRSSTSGIGMLGATLRKHQVDFQTQITHLEAEHKCLISKCDKERGYLQGLLNTEREIRMQEIANANTQIAKSKLELNDVFGRLRAEEDAQARNLILLQERENRIKDLEESNVKQANNYEFRLCDSGSALASATSEIASLKQALMSQQLADKDSQNKIAMLENDKSKMKEEILTAEKKVQKMESAIEMLLNEKNELFLKLKSSECELITCRNEKVGLTQKLGDAHNCVQGLTNDNDIVSSKLVAAQKSNSDLEKVNSEIVVKLLAANAALDSFTSEKIRLMNELQDANSSVRLLTEAKDEAVQNLQDTTVTLEREKSEALSALQDAKSCIDSLEIKESEINNKLTDAQQLTKTLQTEKNDILNQLQGMGDSAKNVEFEKSEAFQKLISAETFMKSLMLEQKEIHDQLGCAKSAISSMELGHNEVLTKLGEAEDILNNVKAQKDDLTDQLHAAQSSLGVLQEKFVAVREEAVLTEERYNTLFTEKQQATKGLLEVGNSIKQLEFEKSALNEQLSSATAKTNALELENTVLVPQLKSAESRIEALEIEIKQVAEQMQNREEAIRVLQGEKLAAMKELDAVKSAIQTLETEKEEFSNKLQEAESSNMTTGKKDLKKIKGLENKVLSLEKEKTKLTTGLQSSNTELNALKEQIKADEEEITEKMASLEVEAESEKAKVVKELRSVQGALDSLGSENKKMAENHRSAEDLKESLLHQMHDLQKQFEESLTLIKVLQNEKNEEILKAKDIQKGVESYKLAFLQQKNDIEAEKVKYIQQVAALTMEISTLQQKQTKLATEKRDTYDKYKSEEKIWKGDRLKLAKATNHYREKVKQLKLDLAKVGEISSASAASIAHLGNDNMATPKSCLRSVKQIQSPMKEVQAPKKRVMFEPMGSGTESETDEPLVSRPRPTNRRATFVAKKVRYYEEPAGKGSAMTEESTMLDT